MRLVFDDEDEHIITTGAVVTLTVRLRRENMSTVFSKEMSMHNAAAPNTVDEDVNEEQNEDKENQDKVKKNFGFCYS